MLNELLIGCMLYTNTIAEPADTSQTIKKQDSKNKIVVLDEMVVKDTIPIINKIVVQTQKLYVSSDYLEEMLQKDIDNEINFIKQKYTISDERLLYCLAVQKIPHEKYALLEKYIDLNNINPVRQANDANFKALFYDVIAIGKIKDSKNITTPASCYQTILDIEIKEYLKAPKNILEKKEIKILRCSGATVTCMEEKTLEQDKEYLFILSNGLLKQYDNIYKSTECNFNYTQDSFLASNFSILTSDDLFKERLKSMEPIIKILCPDINQDK